MLSDEANDLLTVLTKKTGKTEKEIIEEALKMFDKKAEIIKERIAKIELFGEENLLNLDNIIEERIKINL